MLRVLARIHHETGGLITQYQALQPLVHLEVSMICNSNVDFKELMMMVEFKEEDIEEVVCYNGDIQATGVSLYERINHNYSSEQHVLPLAIAPTTQQTGRRDTSNPLHKMLITETFIICGTMGDGCDHGHPWIMITTVEQTYKNLANKEVTNLLHGSCHKPSFIQWLSESIALRKPERLSHQSW